MKDLKSKILSVTIALICATASCLADYNTATGLNLPALKAIDAKNDNFLAETNTVNETENFDLDEEKYSSYSHIHLLQLPADNTTEAITSIINKRIIIKLNQQKLFQKLLLKKTPVSGKSFSGHLIHSSKPYNINILQSTQVLLF